MRKFIKTLLVTTGVATATALLDETVREWVRSRNKSKQKQEHQPHSHIEEN
jgi:hypothetical protein